jgi:hypothetical protein
MEQELEQVRATANAAMLAATSAMMVLMRTADRFGEEIIGDLRRHEADARRLNASTMEIEALRNLRGQMEDFHSECVEFRAAQSPPDDQ